MAAAYTFAATLKAAGSNPTRQDMVDALNSGRSRLGPGIVPFRYAKTTTAATRAAQMGKITNGQIKLFGQPLVTDPGSGAITPTRSRSSRPATRE